jgi:hypothetical protein
MPSSGLANPISHLQKDKRLHHMSTSHESTLSYGQLRELVDWIGEHWECFDPYLPPKDILQARLGEILQIRHRVAHFRAPIDTDVDRVRLLLRDLDAGFFRFCVSLRGSDLREGLDPLEAWIKAEQAEWPVVEFNLSQGYLYSLQDRMDPVFACAVRRSNRPWTKGVELFQPGSLYCVRIVPLRDRSINPNELLELTQAINKASPLVCADSYSVEWYLPGHFGFEHLREQVAFLIDSAWSCVRRGERLSSEAVERYAKEWPENVVFNNHPLALISDDTPCSLVDLADE